MAWPGTTLESATIFKLFGVPQGGLGFRAYAMGTIFGSFGEPFDVSTVANNLTTKLAAVSADQYTLIQADLARLNTIGFTNPIRIYKSAAGSEGTIVDYDLERDRIRESIGDTIGFSVPHGGFTKEIQNGGAIGR